MKLNTEMFESDEILESEIVSKGLISLTPSELSLFDEDIKNLIAKGEISELSKEEIDSLEKAHKDRSKLVLKTIVDTNGKRTKRWVKVGESHAKQTKLSLDGDTFHERPLKGEEGYVPSSEEVDETSKDELDESVHNEAWERHQHNLKVQRQGKESSLKNIEIKYGKAVSDHVRGRHEAPVKAAEGKKLYSESDPDTGMNDRYNKDGKLKRYTGDKEAVARAEKAKVDLASTDSFASDGEDFHLAEAKQLQHNKVKNKFHSNMAEYYRGNGTLTSKEHTQAAEYAQGIINMDKESLGDDYEPTMWEDMKAHHEHMAKKLTTEVKKPNVEVKAPSYNKATQDKIDSRTGAQKAHDKAVATAKIISADDSASSNGEVLRALEAKYKGKAAAYSFMSVYGTKIHLMGRDGSTYHVKYGDSDSVIPHTEAQMKTAGYKGSIPRK